MYIGAHTHGLYALPAYATSPTDLLLNGPSPEDAIPLPNRQESTALLGKLIFSYIYELQNGIMGYFLIHSAEYKIFVELILIQCNKK